VSESLLPVAESGRRPVGLVYVIFSGEGLDFRVFRPKSALREVVLVDGGRFLERAWHEVYFDQEKTPVFYHIGCYFVIGKKRPKKWFSNSFTVSMKV